MRNAKYVALAAVLFICAVSAGAQLNSDTVPTGRTVPLRESVEQQLEESRWHFGPFRVEPALKLENLGYKAKDIQRVFRSLKEPIANPEEMIKYFLKHV